MDNNKNISANTKKDTKVFIKYSNSLQKQLDQRLVIVFGTFHSYNIKIVDVIFSYQVFIMDMFRYIKSYKVIWFIW
jgi:hypothetical protein